MNGTLLGPKPRSLRRRLLLLVSLATLLIYVLAAALSYRQARDEVQELMDSQMTKTARLLLVQAHGESAHLATLTESMAALRGISRDGALDEARQGLHQAIGAGRGDAAAEAVPSRLWPHAWPGAPATTGRRSLWPAA